MSIARVGSVWLLVLLFSCGNPEAQQLPTEASESIGPPLEKLAQYLKFTFGVRSILHDSRGDYWFGSHQEGVCRYDGKTFTYFTTHSGLSGNQVRRIVEDQNGTIWFGTNIGVSRYNGPWMHGYGANPGLTALIPMEPAGEGEWEITDQSLWFNAGNRPGVYHQNGEQLSYLSFPDREDAEYFQGYGVTDIATPEQDRIWISTYSAFCRYNGKDFSIFSNESLGYSEATGWLHVRSIFEDSRSRVWIGNNGIGVLLLEDDELIKFSEREGLVHAESTLSGGPSPAGTLEHVFAIAEDKAGNIWFGDRDTGAWKFDGETMTNYTVDPTLESPMIWDIYQDRDGELLFAMADGGVYGFDGEEFRRKF